METIIYKVKATNGEMEKTEDILSNNEMFLNCKNENEVKEVYEAFWNSEGIKVLEVIKTLKCKCNVIGLKKCNCPCIVCKTRNASQSEPVESQELCESEYHNIEIKEHGYCDNCEGEVLQSQSEPVESQEQEQIAKELEQNRFDRENNY